MQKRNRRLPISYLTILFISLTTSLPIGAETFPARPIDIIVPWGVGGGIDTMARNFTQPLEKILGVALPVSNVPGATGMIGMAKVANASADGYTVAAVSVDLVTSIASGMSKAGIEDYIWLARTQRVESYLFVNADSPFKTIHQLLDHVKANPDEIKLAIVGLGSPDEIALRFLASKGYSMVPSPQPKPGERYAATLGGHADVLYEQAGDVKQFVLSKQLRPLIVFAEKRSPAFPDVPSAKELGFEIFLPQWRAFVMKAGTPRDRVATLAEAMRKASREPKWKEFLQAQYANPKSFAGPEEFDDFAKSQFEQYRSLMTKFGMVRNQ